MNRIAARLVNTIIKERLQQMKTQGFRGWWYLGSNMSLDEAYKEVLRKEHITEQRMAWLPRQADAYVFDDIDGLYDKIQFSKSKQEVINGKRLNLDNINFQEVQKLRSIDVAKYVNFQETFKNLQKCIHLLQIDNDFYAKNDLDKFNNGSFAKLDSNNIKGELERYPFIKALLTGINVRDLPHIKDNINDTVTVSERIDVFDRDALFVYINNKLSIGKGRTTHAKIIADEYKAELPTNIPIDQLNTEQLLAEISKHIDIQNMATGQILQGIAIIDTVTCINCSPNDIKDILKQYVEKVYSTQDRLNLLRIAKVK